MADIEEKKIDVIKITLNLEEAHEVAMALYDHITVKRKKNVKVAPAISQLFEYFDGRLL